jgi:hypothetical protein
VFLPVLLQQHGGVENEAAITKSALDLARNWRQVQIYVGFQEFSTFELLTAHLALVMKFRIFKLGTYNWSLAGEHFFIGETQNRHFEFMSSVDADAQVLLRCGLGRKLFAAHWANVISVICSPIRSASEGIILCCD